MAMGKMSVAYRAKRRYRPKKANRKLATVGTVKKLISNRLDLLIDQSSIAGAAMATTSAIYAINSNLTGNDFVVKSLNVRFSLTTATGPSACRIIIFQFREATVPTYSDILATDVFQSPYTAANSSAHLSKTVNVLVDRSYSSNTDWTGVRNVSYHIPGKKMRKLLESKDGQTNAFYLLAIGSNTNVTLGTIYWRSLHNYC